MFSLCPVLLVQRGPGGSSPPLPLANDAQTTANFCWWPPHAATVHIQSPQHPLWPCGCCARAGDVSTGRAGAAAPTGAAHRWVPQHRGKTHPTAGSIQGHFFPRCLAQTGHGDVLQLGWRAESQLARGCGIAAPKAQTQQSEVRTPWQPPHVIFLLGWVCTAA